MPTPGLVSRPPSAAVLPWILTALAGALDGGCAVGLGDIHVGFVSGDTVEAGKALANGHSSLAIPLLAIVAAFVLGASVGAALGGRVTPCWFPLSLCLIGIGSLAATLGIRISDTVWGVLPLAAGLGAVDAQQKFAGGGVGLSFVTGALVDLGAKLAQPSSWSLRDDSPRLALWLLFLAGSLAGVFMARAFGLMVFLLAVSCLALSLAVLFGVRDLLHDTLPPETGNPP